MATAVTLPPVSNTEDWDETLEIIDDDGEAFNLDGVTAMELIVWDPDTRERKITLSLGSGLAIANSAGGIIELHVAEATMMALAPKNYAFRLGMTSGGAVKDLILPGILPVEDGGP